MEEVTSDELLALKELAQKAKPFAEEEVARTWEEMGAEDKERIGYNADFFLAAHSAIPRLVDELLGHRQTYEDAERKVTKLSVRPGDVLVCKLPGYPTEAQAARVKMQLSSIAPEGVGVIVIPGVVELAIWQKQTGDEG